MVKHFEVVGGSFGQVPHAFANELDCPIMIFQEEMSSKRATDVLIILPSLINSVSERIFYVPVLENQEV